MELQSLNNIFNNIIFRIPDYQRGYSWDSKQLEDLWRDINILEDDKIHYTGTISVKSQEDIHYIIDGQQRITTLIILLQVITTSKQMVGREWINGKELSDYIKFFLYRKTGSQGEITKMVFGYQKDNPSHIYFKTNILELPNTDDSTPENTLYTKKLSYAKSFFTEKISDLSFDNIEIIVKKITEKLKFNYYQIEDELNEFVAFETMNNRGKPLSTLELLKNRLIYLSTLLSNDKAEKEYLRECINNAWKTVYEYLGKNLESPIEDDDFLKDHWISSSNFKYDRSVSKVYESYLLNKYFTINSIIGNDPNQTIRYSKIYEYVSDIQQSVKHYYFIHNPTDTNCVYNDNIQKWLSKLNRLGFATFKPLVTVIFVKKINEQKILKILKLIERYLFVSNSICHKPQSYKNSHFFNLAKKIHSNPENIDLILLDDKIFQSSFKDLLYNFIDKISEKDEFFYKWKGLKYFLYEYELYLKEKHTGERKVEWENINYDSIEHIYPITADGNYWEEEITNSNLVNDLGNLLLLSQSVNSAISNNGFSIKKERYSIDSYSAIEISKSINWTSKEIKERRELLFQFMEERWKINICHQAINKLIALPCKDLPDEDTVMIGEFVKNNMKHIIAFCEKNIDEISILENAEQSRQIFKLDFPFLKKINDVEDPTRYYQDDYTINNEKYSLTSQWFKDKNTLPFKEYLSKIKK